MRGVKRKAVLAVYQALNKCPAVGPTTKTIGTAELGRLYRYWDRLQPAAMRLLDSVANGNNDEVTEMLEVFQAVADEVKDD